MRDENAFNRYLGDELRKLHQKRIFHMKAADKFRSGVSDFIIWRSGKSMALECKFVKGNPDDESKAKLLKHPFTGDQITFLESVSLTGNKAFGLIYFDFADQMIFIPWDKIPENGNWRVCDFMGVAEYELPMFYRSESSVEDILRNIMR